MNKPKFPFVDTTYTLSHITSNIKFCLVIFFWVDASLMLIFGFVGLFAAWGQKRGRYIFSLACTIISFAIYMGGVVYYYAWANGHGMTDDQGLDWLINTDYLLCKTK